MNFKEILVLFIGGIPMAILIFIWKMPIKYSLILVAIAFATGIFTEKLSKK